jgi:hypothetical protein
LSVLTINAFFQGLFFKERKMNIKHYLAAVLAGVFLVMSQQASAITYYLDNSNEEGFLPDGPFYASVTLTQNGSKVDFWVDINDALFEQPDEPNNFGIDAFAFNGDFTADDVSSGLPAGWTASVPTTGNSDGFGRFDAQLDAGTTRVDPLHFTVLDAVISDFELGSTGTAGQGNPWFAAHIAGFCQPGTGGSGEQPACSDEDPTSFWVGGGNGELPPNVIPVPAAVWLFGSGLLGLVGVARRRKSS